MNKVGILRSMFAALVVLILCSLFFVRSAIVASERPSATDMTAACEFLLDQFKGSIKKELINAMAKGGPANAVKTCNVKAVEVAKNFSQTEGWSIKRVTERQRNPNNAPDPYEAFGLLALERTEGEHYRSWEGDGDKQRFRYMQPIRTSGMCLNCHGDKSNMSDSLRTMIEEFYPDDQAHDYKIGQLRGAFSVTVDWPSGRATYDSLTAMAQASR